MVKGIWAVGHVRLLGSGLRAGVFGANSLQSGLGCKACENGGIGESPAIRCE